MYMRWDVERATETVFPEGKMECSERQQADTKAYGLNELIYVEDLK